MENEIAKPYRTTQAATALGVSVPTLKKMVKNGEIAYFTVGKLNELRIEPKAIDDYKNKVAGLIQDE